MTRFAMPHAPPTYHAESAYTDAKQRDLFVHVVERQQHKFVSICDTDNCWESLWRAEKWVRNPELPWTWTDQLQLAKALEAYRRGEPLDAHPVKLTDQQIRESHGWTLELEPEREERLCFALLVLFGVAALVSAYWIG